MEKEGWRGVQVYVEDRLGVFRLGRGYVRNPGRDSFPPSATFSLSLPVPFRSLFLHPPSWRKLLNYPLSARSDLYILDCSPLRAIGSP